MTAVSDHPGAPQDGDAGLPPIHDRIDNRTRWAAFLTILIAQFMNLIDVTIVNVALPSLQSGLAATESQIEWVVAGYILVFALGLLPMGRYGDIVGRKRLFLIGMASFTLASALCGLAPNIEFLVAARLFQGAAGAVMMPQVMAIAQTLFPPRARGGAFALFGLAAGLASVTGPILGGTLINADLWGLGWRSIFLINLPIGLFAMIAAARLIPDLPGNPKLRNDWGGIAFIGAAMLALIFPLVEGRTFGWPLWCFALMAASLPLFAGFVWWEARQDRLGHPQVIPISLLGAWNFVVGGLMSLIYFSAMPAFFLVLALFLQQGFGFDPLSSGLTTVPFPIGVLLASVISGRFGARWQKERILAGLALLFLGFSWLRFEVMGVGNAVDHWTHRSSSAGSASPPPSRRCSRPSSPGCRSGMRGPGRARFRRSSRRAARLAWPSSARSSSPPSPERWPEAPGATRPLSGRCRRRCSTTSGPMWRSPSGRFCCTGRTMATRHRRRPCR